MPFNLLDLPDELIVSVIEELRGDKTTLRSLARCSRRMQSLAEPLLYASIFLRTGNKVNSVSSAFSHRRQRARAVHHLEIRCHHRLMDRSALDRLWELVDECTGVRDLVFESPYCNQGRWRRAEDWGVDMETLFSKFQPAPHNPLHATPFTSLRTAVLHLNGRGFEFWILDRKSAVIFSHPTLLDLTLSSVNVLDDARHLLADHRFTTPLKSLKLDECSVTMRGLEAILNTPKALEHLYIGEDRFSDGVPEGPVRASICNQLCRRDPVRFFSTLGAQKHSLQSLHYTPQPGSLRRHPFQGPTGTAFADFTSLNTLKHEPENFDRLLPLLFSDLTAPPNLEHLTIQYSDDLFTDIHIEDVVGAMPKLKSVELEMSWDRELMREQAKVIKAGQLLRERSIDCRAFVHPRAQFNPPILYGEDIAPKRLIYANYRTGSSIRWPAENDLRGIGEITDSEWDDTDDDGDEVSDGNPDDGADGDFIGGLVEGEDEGEDDGGEEGEDDTVESMYDDEEDDDG